MQFGCTLLHDAACGGSVELVKFLVEEKGLDVQEWNKVLAEQASLLYVHLCGVHVCV